MSPRHLILFNDVTAGMNLYKCLRKSDISCKISFSPAEVEKVCGVAVEYFDEGMEAQIISIAQENQIEIKQFYQG